MNDYAKGLKETQRMREELGRMREERILLPNGEPGPFKRNDLYGTALELDRLMLLYLIASGEARMLRIGEMYDGNGLYAKVYEKTEAVTIPEGQIHLYEQHEWDELIDLGNAEITRLIEEHSLQNIEGNK